MCGNLCRVSADGTKGYCRVGKKRWKRQLASPDELRRMKPSAPRDLQLDQDHLEVIRWTYAVVGHYVHPTLEQWELGFMRDAHPDREVIIWYRIAFAFITYHKRCGLPLRSHAEEARLVGTLASASTGYAVPGEEGKLARQCFEAPDGWEEEFARVAQLDGATWSPPEHLEGWPPPAATGPDNR
jgi:hypothetical protein